MKNLKLTYLLILLPMWHSIAQKQKENLGRHFPKVGIVLSSSEVDSLNIKLDKAKRYKARLDDALIDLDTCSSEKQQFINRANKKLSDVQGLINELPILRSEIQDLKIKNDSLNIKNLRFENHIYQITKPKSFWKQKGDVLFNSLIISLAVSLGIFVSKI